MKRLNLSDFSVKNWANEMYINLNTCKVYQYFNNRYTLVRNKQVLKDIYDYVIKYHKRDLNKKQILNIIFKDDKLNFNLLKD